MSAVEPTTADTVQTHMLSSSDYSVIRTNNNRLSEVSKTVRKMKGSIALAAKREKPTGWFQLRKGMADMGVRTYARNILGIIRKKKNKAFTQALYGKFVEKKKNFPLFVKWWEDQTFTCCKGSGGSFGMKKAISESIKDDATMWLEIMACYDKFLSGDSTVGKPKKEEREYYASMTAHIEYVNNFDDIDSQYNGIGVYNSGHYPGHYPEQIGQPRSSSFGYLHEDNIGGFNHDMSYNMDPNSIILFVTILICIGVWCLLCTVIGGLGGIFAAVVWRKNQCDRKGYKIGVDGHDDEEVAHYNNI